MESKLEKVREFATSEKAYQPPKEVNAKNSADIQDLDEIKLHELRECFNLFDLNNDGFIDANDLRGTFQTMGMEVDDETIQTMMKDASQPMNFDSFAMMMCFKTMDCEPEIVLLEAFSKWDERIQGVISLERILTNITSYNKDRLTIEEAKEALEDAPTVNKPGFKGLQGPTDCWIDYLLWIEKLAGFRKPNMRQYFDT
ncbi:CLUMA_CG008396, isoform A [Clunio marinus]|uniref:CLUMA_CG008396, isoform A n=1 Tax=Clunio marinus TaxID=568069 RepID=A0A1J1I901_9DIPT|nr:CLUMA_CG008396, isoform A [Clunio marinus]